MGQKANPNGLRLGIIRNWESTWFGDGDYKELLLEDFNVRKFVKQELSKAGISKIHINRKSGEVEVEVHVARPGLITGGKGSVDVAVVQEAMIKQFGKNIKLVIIEEKNPDLSARLISEWACLQLEKRVAFRRAMKMAVQRALKSGAKGVKIACSGRLGGGEIARVEWYREGKVPLHTFRADIDYAFSEALTTYGKIGVKVWVYRGEILDTVKHLQKEMAIVNNE